MKKLTFIMMICIIPSIAAANEPASSREHLCKSVYDATSALMKLRQQDAPLPEVMKIANGNQTLEAITIDAYKVPLYSTEEYKKNAISNFANKYYSACFHENSH